MLADFAAKWHRVKRGTVPFSTARADPLFLLTSDENRLMIEDSSADKNSTTPRKPRNVITGRAHHIVNRGNERRRIFADQADYATFLRLLTLGKARYAVKVFGIALIPNHFHGLFQPVKDGALSEYLRWVLGVYASEFRARNGTTGNGHVFQRRFWSDPIKDEAHFLSVLRYVEANALRAGLVERAERWSWCSAVLRHECDDGLLDPLPLTLPDQWIELVNAQQCEVELDTVRRPLLVGRPLAPVHVAGLGDDVRNNRD